MSSFWPLQRSPRRRPEAERQFDIRVLALYKSRHTSIRAIVRVNLSGVIPFGSRSATVIDRYCSTQAGPAGGSDGLMLFYKRLAAPVLVLAVLGLEVFGVILAGYASGSKWSLFGAMREAAQVVSYEVPLGLCVVVPVFLCGTMNLVTIGNMQAGLFTKLLLPAMNPGPRHPRGQVLAKGLHELRLPTVELQHPGLLLQPGYHLVDQGGIQLAFAGLLLQPHQAFLEVRWVGQHPIGRQGGGQSAHAQAPFGKQG